jgi:anti-anti-sigma factor
MAALPPDQLESFALDLRAVTFIDSVALSVLLAMMQRFSADGRRLTLMPSEVVLRVLVLAGVDDQFDLADR